MRITDRPHAALRSVDLAAQVREIVKQTPEYMKMETLTAEEGGCV